MIQIITFPFSGDEQHKARKQVEKDINQFLRDNKILRENFVSFVQDDYGVTLVLDISAELTDHIEEMFQEVSPMTKAFREARKSKE